jgi:hypothetical protein
MVTGAAQLSGSASGRPAGWARGAVALTLVLFSAGSAGAQLAGPEFRVNTTTIDYQGHPVAASDPAGGFWDSNEQDGSGRGVYGQYFDADGAPNGSEFQIHTYTTSSQGIPALAADGAGNFVVTWTSYQQDGNGAGVFAERFVSGVPQGEFPVNTTTLGDQKGVAAAADSAGDTALVWWSVGQDGSGPGIVTRRFDGAGLPVLGEQLVNTFTTGGQVFPAVAAVGGGEFVVTWESDGRDGSAYGIAARRIDAAGHPTGAEILVNSYTTGNQSRPAIAASAAGGFVVVWASNGQDGSGEGVFGRVFDSAGMPEGDDFRVNVTTLAAQIEPAIAADASGGYLVTWESYDGDNHGIYGRFLSSSGTPSSGEFQINNYTTNYQKRPAVASASAGDFLVAWESSYQDASSLGIYAQRARRGLFLDGFESADECAWSTAVGTGGVCP